MSMNFLTGPAALSEAEKQLRKMFVREFLKDHDYYAAAVRCGFQQEMALEQAKELQGDPFTQQLISDAEMMRRGVVKPDELYPPNVSKAEFVPYTPEMDRERIISGLFKEAHYKGPGASHNARVNALGKLAVIFGLDKKDDKPEVDESGVMVVPMTGSLDEWENAAIDQQTNLKQEVRD